MMNQGRDESRLDRIESGIEKFFQGMLELQQAQKKTDEQILELKEAQKKTDEQLTRTIRKLDDIGRQLRGRSAGSKSCESSRPCTGAKHSAPTIGIRLNYD